MTDDELRREFWEDNRGNWNFHAEGVKCRIFWKRNRCRWSIDIGADIAPDYLSPQSFEWASDAIQDAIVNLKVLAPWLTQ